LCVLPPPLFEPLSNNAISGASFLVRIWPRVDKRPNSFPSGGIAHAYFVHIRRRPSLDARETHPIRSVLVELDRRKVGNAIRRYVFAWIAHLIKQLLLDRWNRYASTSSFVLGDHKRSVRLRFDYRIPDVRDLWNCFP